MALCLLPHKPILITTGWQCCRFSLWVRWYTSNSYRRVSEMVHGLKTLTVQDWWPELNAWNPHKGRRREKTTRCCPLSLSYVLWDASWQMYHVHTCRHIIAIINKDRTFIYENPNPSKLRHKVWDWLVCGHHADVMVWGEVRNVL